MAELTQTSETNIQVIDDLDGLKKVAMLMLAAGDSHARMLSDRMDIGDIKMITQEITRLGRIQGTDVEAVLRSFNEMMGSGSSIIGTFDTAKEFLGRIMDDEKVALIMKDIGGRPGDDVWEKLSRVDDTILTNFLKNEYPQTIALVLSKIKTDHGARVLSKLPNEIAVEAMMRMLRLDAVQEDVMTDVEDLLRVEFMANAMGKPPPDQHEVMAEIFNYFDRTTEASLMEMLEDRNKESAELIRSLMFTFDDLGKLDGQAIQLLLRNVDNARLGLALKAGNDALKELFFSNMSERAAKILREDMENTGPVRVKDVEEAQSEIVIAAKALVDSGEISIASDNDEDMI